MNKQRQINHFKRVSKEKIKSFGRNPNKIQKQKDMQGNNYSKSKGKSVKNQQNNQRTSQSKGKNANNLNPKRKSLKKYPENDNQINMKKHLKVLLTKNNIKKSKLGIVESDILKKIEANCKILKKIDEKQHNQYGKNSHKQKSCQQKPSKHNKSESIKNSKLGKSNYEAIGSLKNNRYSYQIVKLQNGAQSKDVKIGIRNDSVPNKLIENMKEYKKSFEGEELKIDKSSKNTNYNTNQSRNSSSLLNSHAFSSVLEAMARNNQLQEKSNKFKAVKNLIKNQQNGILKNNQDHRLSAEVQKMTLNKKTHQQNTKQLRFLAHQQMQKTHKNNQEALQKKQKPQNAVSYDFERSKYYVQPIPPFKCKNKQKQEQIESLLDCEITLIENNVINDSELPQLEL